MTPNNDSSLVALDAGRGKTPETPDLTLALCDRMAHTYEAAARGDLSPALKRLRTPGQGESMEEFLAQPITLAAAELAFPVLCDYLIPVVGAIGQRSDVITQAQAQSHLWPSLVSSLEDAVPGTWPYFGDADTDADAMVRQLVWTTAVRALSTAVGRALKDRGPVAGLSLLDPEQRAALDRQLEQLVTWDVELGEHATKAEFILAHRVDFAEHIVDSLTVAPRVRTRLEPSVKTEPTAQIDWRRFADGLTSRTLEEARYAETWPSF